jgi:hypothetical protein
MRDKIDQVQIWTKLYNFGWCTFTKTKTRKAAGIWNPQGSFARKSQELKILALQYNLFESDHYMIPSPTGTYN